MLEDALATLAMTGATTVVAAMATSAWDAARTGVLRLFGRGAAEPAAIEAQLDGNNALVARAEDGERARQSLVGSWRLQLEELLQQHPDVAGELQDVVADVQAKLPQTQQFWVQNVIARDHGHAYGAMHGNVNVYHAAPGQVQPPKPRD